ncbi:MAG: hypothetical protein EA427_16200 [Spirochaetaceae bacterium]|nr:MAG: hypothetical protein EA427_16200 [Spirochaetaceae bacterium]
MRILRISLENLNSLRGRHSLDFTAEPLAGAGLFAITGPTGAGKSTILDAVTLALYGRAARYGKTSNPEEMMSTHSTHCRAEVEFEVASGFYRAEWELRRARNRSDGKVQPAQRAIYDSGGVPLTQQIRDTEMMIESLIGLNYERFLRSVLLAQGDFAQFLKAPPGERADLLEKLTGSELYTRLSILAHRERTSREQILSSREEELARVPVLTAEERFSRDESLAEARERLESVRREIEAGELTRSRITALQEAIRSMDHAERRLRTVQEKREAGAVELEQLRLHREASPFVGDITRLDGAAGALKRARRLHETARTALEGAQRHRVSALETYGLSISRALENAEKRKEEVRRERDQVQEKVEAEGRRLEEESPDGILAEEITEITLAVEQLSATRRNLEARWRDWESLAKKDLPVGAAAPTEELEKAAEEGVTEVLRETEQTRRALASAESELELRRDHLEKARLLAGYEEQRRSLTEGEPCPLCGSTEHPWADGSGPGLEMSALEAALADARSRCETLRQEEKHGTMRQAGLRTLRTTLSELGRTRDGAYNSLEERLRPLGEEVPVPGREQAYLEKARTRAAAWRQLQARMAEYRERLARLDHLLENALRDLREYQEKEEALPSSLRRQDREWSDEREAPEVPIAEAEYQEALHKERTALVQEADRAAEVVAAEEALTEIEARTREVIGSSPFSDLSTLRAALLPPEHARRLETMESDLKEGETEARTILTVTREEIEKLEARETPRGEAAEEFLARHAALLQEQERLREERTTLTETLRRDDAARRERERLELEQEEERKTLALWNQLHRLIGSHDGSKFKRFAQSVSLDILVRHANRHLHRLTDRYQIRRDGTDSAADTLQLLIEDQHQAGVRRPMESLSGGESFLASLALALGLADLAGRMVRIDSLFIDEGFGSLDPETLDVAISALESLRQSHKTVGVISHVALLKERISTRVSVEKRGDGSGRLRILDQ